MEAKIVVSRMRLIFYLVQPLALPHLIPPRLFPVMGPLLSELRGAPSVPSQGQLLAHEFLGPFAFQASQWGSLLSIKSIITPPPTVFGAEH